MFIDNTGIDLFDQNVGMACANVRLRCLLILLIEYHCANVIDLFDQNVGMTFANVRLRCSWISIVLIYSIKMWVWHDCS